MIKINDTLTITIGNEADWEYRSHINHMPCAEPDNWVSCLCEGSDGKMYKAWYYADSEETELDAIDYEEPDNIEDENGNLIYSK